MKHLGCSSSHDDIGSSYVIGSIDVLLTRCIPFPRHLRLGFVVNVCYTTSNPIQWVNNKASAHYTTHGSSDSASHKQSCEQTAEPCDWHMRTLLFVIEYA